MSKSSIVAASKQAERAAAYYLGGRRLHAGEWTGEGDVDIIGTSFFGQVKHRKDVAGYIQEGMKQLDDVQDSRLELERLEPDIVPEPMPILVIQTKPGSGRPSETYVMMRIQDYVNYDPSQESTRDIPG